jgi:hypothetical protein
MRAHRRIGSYPAHATESVAVCCKKTGLCSSAIRRNSASNAGSFAGGTSASSWTISLSLGALAPVSALVIFSLSPELLGAECRLYRVGHQAFRFGRRAAIEREDLLHEQRPRPHCIRLRVSMGHIKPSVRLVTGLFDLSRDGRFRSALRPHLTCDKKARRQVHALSEKSFSMPRFGKLRVRVAELLEQLRGSCACDFGRRPFVWAPGFTGNARCSGSVTIATRPLCRTNDGCSCVPKLVAQ